MQRINIQTFSDISWEISPPAMRKLRVNLKKNIYVLLNINRKIISKRILNFFIIHKKSIKTSFLTNFEHEYII
jgi:hypothetical protein